MDLEQQLDDLEKQMESNECKEIEKMEDFNPNDYRLNSVEAQILQKQIEGFRIDMQHFIKKFDSIECKIDIIDKKIVSPVETLQEHYSTIKAMKVELSDKIYHIEKEIEVLKNTRFRQFLKKYGAHAITAIIGASASALVLYLKEKFSKGTP